VPEKERSVIVSTSPIQFGYTLPQEAGEFHDNGSYYSLQPGQRFESLSSVPSIWKERPFVDCTRHPIGTGFMDLVQVYNEPSSDPAWLAASYPDDGFVWYALKDPRVLPSVVLWMQNKGRHYGPWNGRTRCLGLEDVCVAMGEDRYNGALRKDLDGNGIVYEHVLSGGTPFVVSYVQGVARVPVEFGGVAAIEFNDGSIDLVSQHECRVRVEVDWKFVSGE
jgi:hypothetical protein